MPAKNDDADASTHIPLDDRSEDKGSEKGLDTSTSEKELVFDEGRAAWLTMFGAFMISFVCYGVANTFGVFVEYLRNNQLADESLSNISWIGSIQLCLILSLGSISGPLFDAGYLKPLFFCGGIIYVFCLFMTSLSTQFYQFILAQGVGVGIGMGCLFAPAVAVLSHHFKRHRFAAFGVFAGGASIGGVVLPIALRQMFTRIGFGWAVRVMAFIVLLCVACGFFCCSSQLPPAKTRKILDFRVFKDGTYTLVIAGASCVAIGLYGPVNFGVTYAVDHGVSPDLAFYSLAILNASSLIGRVGPGFIAQKFGPINTLLVSCLFSGLLLFVWTTARTSAGIIVFNAAFGVASGGYVSTLPAAIASLGKDANDMGLRLGMAFFISSFFWLAGSPIQAALIKTNGKYLAASLFGGGAITLGVGLLLLARWQAAKRKTRQWV